MRGAIGGAQRIAGGRSEAQVRLGSWSANCRCRSEDFAVVGEPVEQSGGHLGVAEHAWSLAEARLVVMMIEVRS